MNYKEHLNENFDSYEIKNLNSRITYLTNKTNELYFYEHKKNELNSVISEVDNLYSKFLKFEKSKVNEISEILFESYYINLEHLKEKEFLSEKYNLIKKTIVSKYLTSKSNKKQIVDTNDTNTNNTKYCVNNNNNYSIKSSNKNYLKTNILSTLNICDRIISNFSNMCNNNNNNKLDQQISLENNKTNLPSNISNCILDIHQIKNDLQNMQKETNNFISLNKLENSNIIDIDYNKELLDSYKLKIQKLKEKYKLAEIKYKNLKLKKLIVK